MKLEDYLKEQLTNPEFRKEYETLDDMKTKFTLAISESGDWQALYINGERVIEGHNIYIIDVLDCINDILPNEYEEIEVSDEIAEAGMPNDLSELEDV